MTVYAYALNAITPQYGECPNVCGQTGQPATEFCTGCPVRKAEDNFKKGAIKILEKRLAGKWQKYGFDNLLQTAQTALDLSENLERREWTVTTERLVGILKSERLKAEKADEFNRRNPEKPKR